jgi:hypothetical protein
MKRIHLLAAEVFAYSFENYKNHLGIGNLRFDKYMPDVVRALEAAEKENWTNERLAKKIEVDVAIIDAWKKRYLDAVEVVDAPTPAASFRNAIRQALAIALKRHQLGDAELEHAVKQVCYRASDLSCLLKRENRSLSDYSDELRREE